jgi:hypothetical protein
LGLPTWSAQITRSGAVPNDEANDQAVVQIGGYRALASVLITKAFARCYGRPGAMGQRVPPSPAGSGALSGAPPAKVEDHRADRLVEAVAEPLDVEATGTEQP